MAATLPQWHVAERLPPALEFVWQSLALQKMRTNAMKNMLRHVVNATFGSSQTAHADNGRLLFVTVVAENWLSAQVQKQIVFLQKIKYAPGIQLLFRIGTSIVLLGRLEPSKTKFGCLGASAYFSPKIYPIEVDGAKWTYLSSESHNLYASLEWNDMLLHCALHSDVTLWLDFENSDA